MENPIMSDTAIMWMEISFNIFYLLIIWGMVYAMSRRQDQVSATLRPQSVLFIAAFSLLALGDTGHVGFRVWAYARGDLASTVTVFGREIGLVGLGALATAFTVTLFYVVLLAIWQRRFQKPYGWFGGVLFLAAIARFLLMVPAGNQWNSTVPPQPWSLYRNLPLVVLGLGVAALLLRDASAGRDRTYQWIGGMILVSYAFYAPVILFVQQVPLIGMLMIPKTLAYVAIAFLAYGRYFKTGGVTHLEAGSIQAI
jgi:hypothetical protein